jgi:hypothetical protein
MNTTALATPAAKRSSGQRDGSCSAMPRVSRLVAASPARTRAGLLGGGNPGNLRHSQGCSVHSSAPSR